MSACRAGPKPQASTSAATVTSNAPAVSSPTRRARASTSSVSGDSAKAAVEACRLKRDSSDAASCVDILVTTPVNAASTAARAVASRSGVSVAPAILTL